MKRNLYFTILLTFIFATIDIHAAVEVLGSLKIVHNSNPGDVIKGQIKLLNSEQTDQEVRIYQTDYLYNFKDETFYQEPGNFKRSNIGWMQYSPKTVILRPKETRNIDYEITVPIGDSIKGTYWSVIMIEGVTPIDPTQKGDMSIRTVTRYAVQIINEMNKKGEGILKFMDPTLIKRDNKVFLAVDLENNGDHFISPEVSIELYDQDGSLVKKIIASKRGVYPTTSTRFLLDLEGIPSKKTYTAMIVAAGADNDVFGLEYTLYF